MTSMNRKQKNTLSVPLLLYVMAYCVVGWAFATGLIYLATWLDKHIYWQW